MSYQTFPDFCPMRDPSDSSEFAVNELNFGDGYDQASKKGINNVREVFARVYHLRDADYQTLKAFVNDHAGAVPFYWLNHTNDVTYLVKVKEGWSANRPLKDVWQVNIEFKQVFS